VGLIKFAALFGEVKHLQHCLRGRLSDLRLFGKGHSLPCLVVNQWLILNHGSVVHHTLDNSKEAIVKDLALIPICQEV